MKIIKDIVCVIETKDEFLALKDRLDGPLERIIARSKAYHFGVVNVSSRRAYEKALNLVKNYAREHECDAVCIMSAYHDTGLIAVETIIKADLYRTK